MTDLRPSGFCVLSFVFHASYSARIALDGFGVVEKSFLASRLGLSSPTIQAVTLKRLLCRSVRRFRPAVVVLGVSTPDTAQSRTLRDLAKKLLKPLRIPIVTHSVAQGYDLLRHRSDVRGREKLARAIVQGFLPGLASELLHTRSRVGRAPGAP